MLYGRKWWKKIGTEILRSCSTEEKKRKKRGEKMERTVDAVQVPGCVYTCNMWHICPGHGVFQEILSRKSYDVNFYVFILILTIRVLFLISFPPHKSGMKI